MQSKSTIQPPQSHQSLGEHWAYYHIRVRAPRVFPKSLLIWDPERANSQLTNGGKVIGSPK